MEDIKLNTNSIENLPLSIYIKYDYLEPIDLIDLLSSLNDMYSHVLTKSYSVYYSEKYQRAFRNVFKVDQINTGNSINIKLIEGWKPEFKLKKRDLDIKVPKLFGIPAIILYSLLLSGQKVLDIQNKHLDNQIKELEIKVKTLELYEKVHGEINPTNSITIYKKPINYVSPRYQDTILNDEAENLIYKLFEKDNIEYVDFNNTIIKQKE